MTHRSSRTASATAPSSSPVLAAVDVRAGSTPAADVAPTRQEDRRHGRRRRSGERSGRARRPSAGQRAQVLDPAERARPSAASRGWPTESASIRSRYASAEDGCGEAVRLSAGRCRAGWPAHRSPGTSPRSPSRRSRRAAKSEHGEADAGARAGGEGAGRRQRPQHRETRRRDRRAPARPRGRTGGAASEQELQPAGVLLAAGQPRGRRAGPRSRRRGASGRTSARRRSPPIVSACRPGRSPPPARRCARTSPRTARAMRRSGSSTGRRAPRSRSALRTATPQTAAERGPARRAVTAAISRPAARSCGGRSARTGAIRRRRPARGRSGPGTAPPATARG